MRSAFGSFLVEALFATLIAAMVASVLIEGYARLKRVGVTAQTQLQATGICSEVFDQLRSQSFTFVVSQAGVHNAIVNDTGAPTGDPLFPRPLLRDNSLSYYAGADANDTRNILHVVNNTVTVNIVQTTPTSLSVTCTVLWSDNSGHHTYTTSSIISKLGLNG